MRQKKTEQERAFQYFLGELSDSGREALEERFFADEDYSDYLDKAETLLVELYAAGELTQKQAQDFEKHFLISERRCEMLQLASASHSQTLLEKKKAVFLSPQEYFRRIFEKFFTASNFGLASSFAASVIFIMLVIFWQQTDTPKNDLTAQLETVNKSDAESPKPFSPLIEDQSAQTQIAVREKSKPFAKFHAEKRGKSTAAALPPAKSEAVSQKAFTLLPPVISPEKSLVVSSTGAENVRLRVVHNNEEHFVKYLVEIHASDGDLIWSREIAVTEKSMQKPFALAVRRGALTDGNYDLTISGATSDGQLEEVNNYNFTFRKKLD